MANLDEMDYPLDKTSRPSNIVLFVRRGEYMVLVLRGINFTQKRYGRRGGVPEFTAILVVVATMICQPSQCLQLRLILLRNTLRISQHRDSGRLKARLTSHV